MDTYVELKAYGNNSEAFLSAANEEVLRLEALCSAVSEKSELYLLNESGGGKASPELAELIETSLTISEETDGTFDPTVRPLMTLWGFTDGSYRIPTPDEISAAFKLVGAGKVAVSDVFVELNGAKLDLGGIAKGYATDRFAILAAENGVESAFASLGGMVCAVGTKPSGKLWRVALRSPTGDGYAAIMEVSDACISTSGGYERYFMVNGTLYHHIIDPATGYPANSDLLSATVIDGSGTCADALSTALFVMGESTAASFCTENEICAVLITNDKKLLTFGGAESLITEIHSDFVLTPASSFAK